MRCLGAGIALAVAYAVIGKLGLLLAIAPGYASPIFPAAGIAVAAMLIGGAATLPWIFLGSLLLNIWVGCAIFGQLDRMGLAAAAVIATGSTLQGAAGGWALRRTVGYPAALDNGRDLARFLGLCPVFCLTNATLSLGGLTALGVLGPADLPKNWPAWWIGDTLGVLNVLPLMLVLLGEPRELWRRRALPVALPMVLFFTFFVAIFVRVSTWEADLAGQHRYQSWSVLVVGICSTGLLGALLMLATGYAHRVEIIVEQRTRDLRRVNRQLQNEMRERQQAEAALRQAQRMEAIGQLTGGIAHDFNNLLTVVAGNATLLRDHAADEPARRRALAILSVVERGERLTRQLLAFSRRRALRPEVVMLQRRAGEIAELLARTLRETIEVTIDLPEDLWQVAVDPSEFELALLNIAVNARDAMPNGGVFRLEASNARCGGGAANGGLCGDFVAIALSDTGTGMPAEVAARAFEPYFTTKDVGHGSGLGLSQVYGFVSQSGGAAVIASEPGEGTEITLFLPRASAAPMVSSPTSSSTALASGPARILLVEDDREVAETTEELLRDIGFETRWAQDGNKALALIEGGLSIDLVLSDVVMPGEVSGLDLARRVREQRPELPVIMATGYSRYAAQVVNEGFALVEKPYHRDVLVAALRSVLERRPSA